MFCLQAHGAGKCTPAGADRCPGSPSRGCGLHHRGWTGWQLGGARSFQAVRVPGRGGSVTTPQALLWVAARLSQSQAVIVTRKAGSDEPLAPFSLSGRGCPSLRHNLVFHKASGTSGGFLVKQAAARLTQSQAETCGLKPPDAPGTLLVEREAVRLTISQVEVAPTQSPRPLWRPCVPGCQSHTQRQVSNRSWVHHQHILA